MNQTQIRYILAAGWGVYAGVAIGYFASKKKHQRVADAEIDSVKEVYQARQEAVFRQVVRPDPYELTDDNVDSENAEHVEYVEKAIIELMSSYESDSEVEPQTPEERVAVKDRIEEIEEDETYTDPEDLTEYHNLFETGGDIYPPTQVEDPTRPYTISVDEYNHPEVGLERVSLTYYEGDDVLADDSDKVVRSIDNVIGDDSLTKFGDRSGDEKIVYVRNERLEMDYEVVLNEKSFQEVVLGIKSPKMRNKIKEDDDS